MATKKFGLGKIAAPVSFTVDDDEFTAIPANRLPAGVLAKYFEDINGGKLFEAHEVFFQTVLTEDSWKVFSDRLNSKDKPITVTLMGDIVTWLLGDEYMGNVREGSK